MSIKENIRMYFGSSLYQAFFSDNVESNGMGSMVISRKTAGGMIAGVVFLCDHYCLGVKDCFAFLETEAGYRIVIGRIREAEALREVNPSVVRTYVPALVRWARSIGFDPASDYRICSEILQGIPEDPSLSFTFGDNGLPHYINGPNDIQNRIIEIVRKLEKYQERTGEKAYLTLMGPIVAALPPEITESPLLALE